MKVHRRGKCVHFICLMSNSEGGMENVRITRQTGTQHGGLSGSVDSVGSQQIVHTQRWARGYKTRWLLAYENTHMPLFGHVGSYPYLHTDWMVIDRIMPLFSFGYAADIIGSLRFQSSWLTETHRITHYHSIFMTSRETLSWGLIAC